MKKFFTKAERAQIQKLLVCGVDIENIPGLLHRKCMWDFQTLPLRMQTELRLLDAKRYLTNFPDATKEEIRMVKAWVMDGHRPEQSSWFIQEFTEDADHHSRWDEDDFLTSDRKMTALLVSSCVPSDAYTKDSSIPYLTVESRKARKWHNVYVEGFPF